MGGRCAQTRPGSQGRPAAGVRFDQVDAVLGQFVQRVVKDSGKLYAPLEAVIAEEFLPALLNGQRPTAEERELYSMPVKYGGLGISDPTVTADSAFATSRAASDHLAAAIKGEGEFNIAQHQQCGREARAKHKANKKTQLEAQALLHDCA